MIFSSNIFIFCFLPIVISLYYTVFRDDINKRNLFLFVASLIFYAWGEPVYIVLMLFSLMVNYLFGIQISKTEQKRKWFLVTAISINLGLLFLFKYLGFTMEVVGQLTGVALPKLALELPIGISFYTFQGISYLVDVYRGDGKVQRSFLNVGLYIAFFPQLIAGPIVRYVQIEHQLNYRVHYYERFSGGGRALCCWIR